MKAKTVFILLILLFFSTINPIVSSEQFSMNSYVETSDLEIIDMIQQINYSLVHSSMQSLLSFGPRYTGSENCSKSGDWIYDTFVSLGYETTFHHWECKGFSSRNVVATLPGSDPTSEAEIILSGHYDCTPGSLGANDDASGVVALIAAATVMRGYSFNHTIRFIAFSGEEVGTYGSFCYARDAYRNGDAIYAVLNLDMIGYASTKEGGDLLRFHCPDRSWWIGESAQTYASKYYQFTNMSVETRPNYIGADHQAFIDYGYDGVWIAHRDGHPWANTPGDTPDHLNWTYLIKAAKAMSAITAEFARESIPIQVSIVSPGEGCGYLFDLPIMSLDLGEHWYRGIRGATVVFGRPKVSVDITTKDAIDRVIYCVDGNFIVSLSTEPFEWKFQGKHVPFVGRHTLQVYAYTERGDVGFDEMELWVFSLSCQYGKW